MDQTTHYYFADCAGRLVDIRDYDREADAAPACPGCGAQFVAVRGEQRGWHFRHRNGGGCDPGTYSAACNALQRQTRRIRLLEDAPLLRHPLIVGVGILAAVSFIYLLGEARR